MSLKQPLIYKLSPAGEILYFMNCVPTYEVEKRGQEEQNGKKYFRGTAANYVNFAEHISRDKYVIKTWLSGKVGKYKINCFKVHCSNYTHLKLTNSFLPHLSRVNSTLGILVSEIPQNVGEVARDVYKSFRLLTCREWLRLYFTLYTFSSLSQGRKINNNSV